MATLVVIGYADQGVAEAARKSVQELEDELTIESDHVASIARDVEGRYHAHISHSGPPPGGGVDWGGFWGAVFDLLFSVPSAGLTLSSGTSVLRHDLGEEGIDRAFQDQVRKRVKPGTSALFILVERDAPDKAVGSLARYGGTMIKASLSDAEFDQLRKALERPAASARADSVRRRL
jgi:uncharacterized membrane protein